MPRGTLIAQMPVETKDARLREVLDAMPHKVWMVRPDGPAIYYNRAMREFAGEALTLPERSGREIALIHPEDLPTLAAARSAAAQEQKNCTLEVRLKCPDGSWRWHQLDFSRLWSGNGDFWLVAATDIHDLKLAMLAAQESGEQFRLAAEAAHLGVYSFDLQTGDHVWSHELKDIFGLCANAPAPTDVLQYIHPDDRQRVRALRQQSIDPQGAGAFEDQHRIIRADGSIRWVFVKGRMSFVGEGAERKPKCGVGFVLDVTERNAAEQALAQSEERYRTLVDNANDVVATLDLELRFTSVNPAVERILGYTPQEMIGTELSRYVPASQFEIQQKMLLNNRESELGTHYEMQLMGKNPQRLFTLEVSSKLLFDERGKPIAVHAIARDITERKNAEARQAVLIRELQHRTKNMLAVIQSITSNTLRRSHDLESAHEALIGRLHALAHAQQFVASGATGGAPLRELIEGALSSFGARASLSGYPIVTGNAFAQMFALVVHELATNAAKHGSLSSSEGRVLISWKIDNVDDEPSLNFSWVERGGPPVRPNRSEGFGSQLLSMVGKPELAFKREGFEYALTIAISEVMR
jgi:PAS domain S-box-containing protein